MTNLIRPFLILLVSGLLAACGGGGGTAPFGGSTGSSGGGTGSGSGGSTATATPASVDVVSGSTTVGTGASDVVTITATVKDAGNVSIAAAPIRFSTDSGNLISAATVTDASGQAVATLSAGSDKTNRPIKVTATSGSVSGSATIAVVSASPAAVDVVASASRLGTGGSPITITAVVKNASNVALAGVPIQFSADTGNLVSSATTTNANGAATAQFSSGANRSNRSATISVVSGNITGRLTIAIDGSVVSVTGPETLKLGDTNQQAELSIKVSDSSGSPIAGLPLTIAGTLGNIPAGATATTDSSGSATYSYPARVAGADVVTVVGAGISSTIRITISGQDFTFTTPAAGTTINVDPAGSTGQSVAVRYLVNGQAPGPGLPAYKVRFASTAGSVLPAAGASSGIDLVGGTASVVVTSRFAGPATIQATVFNPAVPNVAVAQASLSVQFVATVPSSLVLQVSPSAIGPNTAGSTTQQAEVRATVLDAASNPVAGVAVNFSRVSDPSGGNLLQASASTDSNGIARVQYVSGAQSTQTDGVVLQASVAASSNVLGQARLTVNQSALFIALGQGNEISNVNPTTYRKQWTAYVTDSTGAPVPNITLTISALPTKYGKGTFVYVEALGLWVSNTYQASAALPDGRQDPNVLLTSGNRIFCPSEDTISSTPGFRNNGVLDPGEDVNNSGKLEPGNVISVNGVSSLTTLRTDSTGFALINLEYAESYAYWVQIGLKVSAVVAGTESSNTAVFLAPGLASDYSSSTVAPAGQTSPFGVVASCSVKD